MVKITINKVEIEVPENSTVLDAAKAARVHIPTLCTYPGVSNIGACRLCIVEVEGMKDLPASCTLPVKEGMKVLTNTPKVREARKAILQLILSEHPADCQTCTKNQRCELQRLTFELGVRELPYEHTIRNKSVHKSSPYIIRDMNYCILCGRCTRVCSEIQGVNAIDYAFRGYNSEVNVPYDEDLATTKCVSCAQCVLSCPTGALYEKSNIDDVWRILNSDKLKVVQFAPAIRVAIGEEFGLRAGELTTGKIVSALKRLGFNKVFDTNFAADLTIMEEGSEFLERATKGDLPMFTSCCPAWINYAELFYPKLLSRLSSCKSPHEMLGALVKSYYAEKIGVEPSNISVVSIMPCVAKKQEIDRAQLSRDGRPDVDVVLTTRELASMIKEAGIDFQSLEDQEQDEPLGLYTGSAAIFGASGGVMEAALRSVYKLVTNQELENIDFVGIRGLQGVKEASVKIADKTYNVAVVNGLSNAQQLIDDILLGKRNYHFVEVMACPGGCIGGGGQPIANDKTDRFDRLRERINALYALDQSLELRRSHQHPAVLKLYEEFLGKPLGHRSHELLHTSYQPRQVCCPMLSTSRQ